MSYYTKILIYYIWKLSEAFSLFDTENRGLIAPNELKSAMQSLGYDQKSSKNVIVCQIIEKLENEKSLINFDTFLDIMTVRLVICLLKNEVKIMLICLFFCKII